MGEVRRMRAPSHWSCLLAQDMSLPFLPGDGFSAKDILPGSKRDSNLQSFLPEYNKSIWRKLTCVIHKAAISLVIRAFRHKGLGACDTIQKPIIGRENLALSIVNPRLAAHGLRFDHPGRRPWLWFPKPKVLKNLLYDVFGLDERYDGHLPVALRTGQGIDFITILLTEQYARPILPIIDFGYILENGGAVLEDTSQELMDNPDVNSAYFGL
jgi:hypothetical protein